MVFISDTNEHEIETSDIVVIADAIFDILETPGLIKYEGTQPIAGTGAVTFLAGMELDFKVTRLKLLQGAIRVK